MPRKPKYPSVLQRMREAFELANLDTDNMISREEFEQAMASIGISEEVAQSIFNRFDPDRNGQLDLEEFFAYAGKGGGDLRTLLRRSLPEVDEDTERVIDMFKHWDTDGDGTITRAELKRVLLLLNPAFTEPDLSKLMKAADKNKDGIIDFEEFVEWLTGTAPPRRGIR